jgi:flagellar basal body rod protein FlgG
VTTDDLPVLGESGGITLGSGRVTIDDDGTLRTGGVAAGRLRVVDFADPSVLARETNGRFRAPEGAGGEAARARVLGGNLEQSNVSVVERMAQLTEVARGFEALQRGLTILMNDVDGRAISELGRR